MNQYVLKILFLTLCFLPNYVFSSEELAKNSSCLECHGSNQSTIGPSFKDISSRYRNDPQARNKMINVIKSGGKGNWSEVSKHVPMPSFYSRLSLQEIEALADWALNH